MPPLVPRKEWVPRFAHTRPQLAPLRDACSFLDAQNDWPSLADLNHELARRRPTVATGLATTLVEQPMKRPGVPPIDQLYDGRIYLRGEIPTRSRTWHDLFNVIGWLAFPQTKRAINQRQYEALVPWYDSALLADGTRPKLPGARTREQDALAMVDEGGLLLLVDETHAQRLFELLDQGTHDELLDLVREHALVPIVFGHAMHEHLMSSDAPVRALPIPLRCGAIPSSLERSIALADRLLAAALEDRASFRSPSRLKGVELGDALFRDVGDPSRNWWTQRDDA